MGSGRAADPLAARWSFPLLKRLTGGAAQGELAATAVNAPMVPAEVLRELQPYVSLAEGLGRAAVQLVSTGGFTDIHITYATPRGDDLDTRLLRAMVIKGILEQITTATVNLVNADVLARARGLRIIESTVPAAGKVRGGVVLCRWLPGWPLCSCDLACIGSLSKALSA